MTAPPCRYEDPRDYGLTAADLHAAADRLYPPGDPRLYPLPATLDAAVRLGEIRSRLHGLADAIEDDPPPQDDDDDDGFPPF